MSAKGLPLPRVIGHRGLASLAPENTLAGLRAAAAHGLSMVEFDVRLSADGVPLLFHDDELERTSSGRGEFGDASAEALRRLDAGGWFSPEFRGERIPSLEEALGLCRTLGLKANVELKPNARQDEATARAVAEVLRRLAVGPAQLLISSFNVPALAAARDLCPEYPRGFLIEAWPADLDLVLRRLDCRYLHASLGQIEGSALDALRAQGYGLLVYTVNVQREADALWARGIDAVFSDYPLREPLGASAASL